MTVWLRGWLANETSPKSQAQLSRSEKAPSSGPFAITVPATWLLARNAASSSSRVWGSELLTPQPVERSGRSSLVATPNSQPPTIFLTGLATVIEACKIANLIANGPNKG